MADEEPPLSSGSDEDDHRIRDPAGGKVDRFRAQQVIEASRQLSSECAVHKPFVEKDRGSREVLKPVQSPDSGERAADPSLEGPGGGGAAPCKRRERKSSEDEDEDGGGGGMSATAGAAMSSSASTSSSTDKESKTVFPTWVGKLLSATAETFVPRTSSALSSPKNVGATDVTAVGEPAGIMQPTNVFFEEMASPKAEQTSSSEKLSSRKEHRHSSSEDESDSSENDRKEEHDEQLRRKVQENEPGHWKETRRGDFDKAYEMEVKACLSKMAQAHQETLARQGEDMQKQKHEDVLQAGQQYDRELLLRPNHKDARSSLEQQPESPTRQSVKDFYEAYEMEVRACLIKMAAEEQETHRLHKEETSEQKREDALELGQGYNVKHVLPQESLRRENGETSKPQLAPLETETDSESYKSNRDFYEAYEKEVMACLRKMAEVEEKTPWRKEELERQEERPQECLAAGQRTGKDTMSQKEQLRPGHEEGKLGQEQLHQKGSKPQGGMHREALEIYYVGEGEIRVHERKSPNEKGAERGPRQYMREHGEPGVQQSALESQSEAVEGGSEQDGCRLASLPHQQPLGRKFPVMKLNPTSSPTPGIKPVGIHNEMERKRSAESENAPRTSKTAFAEETVISRSGYSICNEAVEGTSSVVAEECSMAISQGPPPHASLTTVPPITNTSDQRARPALQTFEGVASEFTVVNAASSTSAQVAIRMKRALTKHPTSEALATELGASSGLLCLPGEKAGSQERGEFSMGTQRLGVVGCKAGHDDETGVNIGDVQLFEYAEVPDAGTGIEAHDRFQLKYVDVHGDLSGERKKKLSSSETSSTSGSSKYARPMSSRSVRSGKSSMSRKSSRLVLWRQSTKKKGSPVPANVGAERVSSGLNAEISVNRRDVAYPRSTRLKVGSPAGLVQSTLDEDAKAAILSAGDPLRTEIAVYVVEDDAKKKRKKKKKKKKKKKRRRKKKSKRKKKKKKSKKKKRKSKKKSKKKKSKKSKKKKKSKGDESTSSSAATPPKEKVGDAKTPSPVASKPAAGTGGPIVRLSLTSSPASSATRGTVSNLLRNARHHYQQAAYIPARSRERRRRPSYYSDYSDGSSSSSSTEKYRIVTHVVLSDGSSSGSPSESVYQSRGQSPYAYQPMAQEEYPGGEMNAFGGMMAVHHSVSRCFNEPPPDDGPDYDDRRRHRSRSRSRRRRSGSRHSSRRRRRRSRRRSSSSSYESRRPRRRRHYFDDYDFPGRPGRPMYAGYHCDPYGPPPMPFMQPMRSFERPLPQFPRYVTGYGPPATANMPFMSPEFPPMMQPTPIPSLTGQPDLGLGQDTVTVEIQAPPGTASAPQLNTYPSNAHGSGSSSSGSVAVDCTISQQPGSYSSSLTTSTYNAGVPPAGYGDMKPPYNPWMAPYNERSSNQGNLVLTVIFALGIAACVIALIGQYNRYRDRAQEEQDLLEEGTVMHGPELFNISGVGSSLVIRGYKLCHAQDCKLEAARLSRVLAAGPCDSFYDYVCSRRWAQKPTVMRTMDDVALQDIQDSVWKHIRQGKDRKVASVIWKSCMDTMAIDNAGTAPFYDVLNSSGLAGWPFHEVSPMPNPWHAAGRLARLLDLAALLSVRVHHNAGSALTIVLGHAATPLSPRDFRLNATTTAFLRRVENTVSFLAPEENETTTRAVEVLNFVLRLVNLNSAKGRASSLGAQTPFKEFLDAAIGDLVDLQRSDVHIKIESSKYGSELNRTVTAVSPRSALNYLGFYAVDHLRAFSPVTWDRGVPAGQRERSCLQMAERAVPSQILEIGYHTYKKRLNITSLRRLTSETKRRLVDNIRSLSWMEHGMKAKVIEKVHKTSVEMLFPRHLISTGSLPGGTPPLPPNTSGALELYQRAVEYRFKSAVLNAKDTRPARSLFSRRIEVDARGVLHVPLATVANLSGPTLSAFVSLLRETRLSVRLAKALLEAALGRTADDRSVWTPVARAHYRDLQNCFEKQYSALHDPLDGVVVQKPPAVVADDLMEHVAVALAYLEFRTRVQFLRGNLSDYRLADAPGFSSERLFFVSYAESACETYDDEWTFREFLAHRESPARQRVDMALAHDRNFQRAFRCRRGYRMRPTRTCAVW